MILDRIDYCDLLVLTWRDGRKANFLLGHIPLSEPYNPVGLPVFCYTTEYRFHVWRGP